MIKEVMRDWLDSLTFQELEEWRDRAQKICTGYERKSRMGLSDQEKEEWKNTRDGIEEFEKRITDWEDPCT